MIGLRPLREHRGIGGGAGQDRRGCGQQRQGRGRHFDDICNFSGTTMTAITDLPVRVITIG
jgi:hypothetical protein